MKAVHTTQKGPLTTREPDTRAVAVAVPAGDLRTTLVVDGSQEADHRGGMCGSGPLFPK